MTLMTTGLSGQANVNASYDYIYKNILILNRLLVMNVSMDFCLLYVIESLNNDNHF